MNARTDAQRAQRFLNSYSGGVSLEAVTQVVPRERAARLAASGRGTTWPQVAGPGLVIMGVTKDLVKAGDGKTFPKTGDELTMHYTGWLARTETKFDSSVDKGKPFVFKVHAF